MKKLIYIIFSGCMFLSAAEARMPERRPFVDWKSELNMDNAQKERVDEIYAQSYEKIKSLKEQIAAMHKEIADTQEENDRKIREFLTEKQQIKFDKIKARMQKGQGTEERKKGEKKPSRKRMRQF